MVNECTLLLNLLNKLGTRLRCFPHSEFQRRVTNNFLARVAAHRQKTFVDVDEQTSRQHRQPHWLRVCMKCSGESFIAGFCDQVGHTCRLGFSVSFSLPDNEQTEDEDCLKSNEDEDCRPLG